eukprot:12755674-Alexandrium_andersonii.AAC.1
MARQPSRGLAQGPRKSGPGLSGPHHRGLGPTIAAHACRQRGRRGLGSGVQRGGRCLLYTSPSPRD